MEHRRSKVGPVSKEACELTCMMVSEGDQFTKCAASGGGHHALESCDLEREQTSQIENWHLEVNAVMEGSIKSAWEIKNADSMNLSRNIDMKLTSQLDPFKQNVDTEISVTDTKWTSKFANVSTKINNTQNL
eukprot:7117890-Ditylum_brightwellii.AAC.1